jgi:hypothetical protein
MVVSQHDAVQCTCGRRGARDPQAVACGEAFGGTPMSEAKSSEGKDDVTLGERAMGFPNRLSRGLPLRAPLRYYSTASCGACPPTRTAPAHMRAAPCASVAQVLTYTAFLFGMNPVAFEAMYSCPMVHHA